jgi:thiol-disulfide isomerase/thioredoxin
MADPTAEPTGLARVRPSAPRRESPVASPPRRPSHSPHRPPPPRNPAPPAQPSRLAMLLPLSLLLLAPLPQAEPITATLAPRAPDEIRVAPLEPQGGQRGARAEGGRARGGRSGSARARHPPWPSGWRRRPARRGSTCCASTSIATAASMPPNASPRRRRKPAPSGGPPSTARSPSPVPADASANTPARTRPYPLSLWFVEDPAEPDAKPALRWTRRGWHEGQVTLDGKPAFVLLNDMELDGRFDQRDAWALARERKGLFSAEARSLETHVWLDGKAWRAVAVDPHGRSLAFESFDPGITEAEEKAKADLYAPDRAAPRAKVPLAFGHDLAAALERAKREKKRVLVDFETTWCGPCKVMDQLVYSAQPVVDAAREVIAVKLDGDEHRDLVKRYKVEGYPTMILLDADGKELRRGSGYHSVVEMVALLKP